MRHVTFSCCPIEKTIGTLRDLGLCSSKRQPPANQQLGAIVGACPKPSFTRSRDCSSTEPAWRRWRTPCGGSRDLQTLVREWVKQADGALRRNSAGSAPPRQLRIWCVPKRRAL